MSSLEMLTVSSTFLLLLINRQEPGNVTVPKESDYM